MPSSRRARRPGITLLVLAALVGLASPLVIVAVARTAEADAQLVAARRVSARTAEFEGLLALAPELATERNATGALLGTLEIPSFVRGFAVDPMAIDFEAELADARSAFDDRSDGAPPGFTDDLGDLRNRVDRGELGPLDADAGYRDLQERLDTSLDEARTSLIDLATEVDGDTHLVTDVLTAETVADVERIQVGLSNLWTRVSVPLSPYDDQDVRAFSDELARLDRALVELDLLLDPERDINRRAAELTTEARLDELIDRYESTVSAVYGTTVDMPSGPAAFASVDFVAMNEQVALVGDTLRLSAEVTDALGGASDITIGHLGEEAAEIEQAAADTRRTTLLVAAAVIGAVVIGGLVLVRLVVLPVNRVAAVATAVRDGRLDVTERESGPRELAVATRALNEAVETMRLAEAQATALAEERLEDPILSEDLPGRLGESLRAAINRLTTSLAERESFQRRLAHEAAHDGLTKLPNRTAVMSRITSSLARTERSSSQMALLFIDLDGFKRFNDEHGHHVGDLVLQKAAQRLLTAVRAGDVAGRLGGDEFVVVAEAVDGIDDALEIGERILAEMARPIVHAGSTIRPSASIGVAVSDGHGLTAEELLRDADLALFRAKELGRNRIEICDEELREQVVERAQLENAIAAGLADGEFVLHFQPMVDSHSRAVTSLEALVRWDRPGVGLVPPGDFIPVAERSELIVELDRWVIDEAARQLVEWTDHPLLSSLGVSVNVSGRHLSCGSIVDDVRQAIDRHGVDPTRLTLELTETALMDDISSAAHDLALLRRLGVRIALDDFGTGYMSLATLRELPVDILKIDRSFVAEIGGTRDHTLVELIVKTGHLLGVDVTAEGVETDEQMQLLTQLGSDHLQGFLFSRPVPAAELEGQLHHAAAPVGT